MSLRSVIDNPNSRSISSELRPSMNGVPLSPADDISQQLEFAGVNTDGVNGTPILSAGQSFKPSRRSISNRSSLRSSAQTRAMDENMLSNRESQRMGMTDEDMPPTRSSDRASIMTNRVQEDNLVLDNQFDGSSSRSGLFNSGNSRTRSIPLVSERFSRDELDNLGSSRLRSSQSRKLLDMYSLNEKTDDLRLVETKLRDEYYVILEKILGDNGSVGYVKAYNKYGFYLYIKLDTEGYVSIDSDGDIVSIEVDEKSYTRVPSEYSDKLKTCYSGCVVNCEGRTCVLEKTSGAINSRQYQQINTKDVLVVSESAPIKIVEGSIAFPLLKYSEIIADPKAATIRIAIESNNLVDILRNKLRKDINNFVRETLETEDFLLDASKKMREKWNAIENEIRFKENELNELLIQGRLDSVPKVSGELAMRRNQLNVHAISIEALSQCLMLSRELKIKVDSLLNIS